MRAQIGFLPDGRRLHLQDGPIDLIIEAWGAPVTVKAAYDAAVQRFVHVLDELCAELPLLRSAAGPNTLIPKGTTARLMTAAVAPYAARTFITPMAAVAGAVAQDILESMTSAARLVKAYVNDGGDIALHLMPGEQFVIGMVERPDRPSLFGTATLHAHVPGRGIATSGWRGRSFSLGIADAVTVLASTAARADAAATVVANAVDLPGHSCIQRVPACTISPDSDLGGLLVTREVPRLSAEEIVTALENGVAVAGSLMRESLIHSAALHLQGVTRIVTAGGKLAFTGQPSARSLIHA